MGTGDSFFLPFLISCLFLWSLAARSDRIKWVVVSGVGRLLLCYSSIAGQHPPPPPPQEFVVGVGVYRQVPSTLCKCVVRYSYCIYCMYIQ